PAISASYTVSLHDALPICGAAPHDRVLGADGGEPGAGVRDRAGDAAAVGAARAHADVLRRRGDPAGGGVRPSAAAPAAADRPSRNAGDLRGQGRCRVAGRARPCRARTEARWSRGISAGCSPTPARRDPRRAGTTPVRAPAAPGPRTWWPNAR